MSEASVRTLRILLATEWLLVVGGVLLGFLLEPTLPPELRLFNATEEQRPFHASELIGLGAASLCVLLWLAGSVGAFLLWRPARLLYLAAVIAGVALMPLFGPSVLAPLASAFDQAGSILSGLVLGTLYFSELRHRFRLGVTRE
jgi:hypothetical protein